MNYLILSPCYIKLKASISVLMSRLVLDISEWNVRKMFQYEGAKVQLLDLPGIIEGAAQGEL